MKMNGKMTVATDRIYEEYLPNDTPFLPEAVADCMHGLTDVEQKMLICIADMHIRRAAKVFGISKSEMGRRWITLREKIRKNMERCGNI